MRTKNNSGVVQFSAIIIKAHSCYNYLKKDNPKQFTIAEKAKSYQKIPSNIFATVKDDCVNTTIKIICVQAYWLNWYLYIFFFNVRMNHIKPEPRKRSSTQFLIEICMVQLAWLLLKYGAHQHARKQKIMYRTWRGIH